MTSTNDGKDVKSNQTSGQRGKTYYIELYKSLEAGLNEESSVRARNKHVCEAWRRIHSLCQHSAPTTHAHLLSWLQRHTARTVLHTEWPKSKDEHTNLEEAIHSFVQECQTAIACRNGISPPWESQLLQRGEWFKRIIPNPWGHPVLKVLLDPQGTPPSDKEVLEWLKEERGVMFVTRLRQLSASKCDDLALMLASNVMDRVRAGMVEISDVDQLEEAKDNNTTSEGAEPTFADLLSREAGFTIDVWELITDLEFVLLHKWDKQAQCITLAKKTPLRKGYQLVERLRCRLETSPREKKLWKNSKDTATLIAQVIIARCMVVPRCAGVVRAALQGCARALARLVARARLPAAAAALAAPAASAAHLHALAAAVHAQSTEEMKPFVCELYVRAITAGMNELEKLKLKTEKESEARATERTLSSWLSQLGALLAASARIRCECALTAFSVHPSPAMYAALEAAPVLPPLALDDDSKEEVKSEFGSWANDSRTQTNFVKTSETLNLKQTQQRANVLSTAIFSEGEALGLSAELCQDLTVCLSGPRVKTFSWDMDREQLLENCRSYMERTNGGTRALTTELKYLNLDPSAYEHLPEEEDDETDIYYGIEKGYEHLVEFQEPEEMWHFDPERTESASSCMETECVTIKPRKKKKHILTTSEEDTDPLSLVAETKQIEKKKERPHSKERSKEHRKKKSEKHHEDNEFNRERRKDNCQSKEKKKEKKSKKEKIPKEQKSNSLSCLIGMKVFKSGTEKKDETETKLAITDSDYDSQGKSSITSINSEGNNMNVVFDGLFSMDDYKSPENNLLTDKPLIKNSELSIADGQVAVNTTSKVTRKLSIERAQSLDSVNIPTKSIVKPTSSTVAEEAHVDAVREEVTKSIRKLLDFRRQNVANEDMFNSATAYYQTHYNKNDNIEQRAKAIISPEFPSQSFVSPKAVTVPDIPKVYINKKQTEQQLHQLKREINSVLNMNNVINTEKQQFRQNERCSVTHLTQNVTKSTNKLIKSNCIDTATSLMNHREVTKNRIYENKVVPSSFSDQTNVSNSNKPPSRHSQSNSALNQQYSPFAESGGQKTFEEFLKELQQSINAGTGNKVVEKSSVRNSNVIAKKEIRPMSKVTPLIPNISNQIERSVNPSCAKQIGHQKKTDNAPNTFSRLSYMHKNKHSDAKLKQHDMSNRQEQLLKETSMNLSRSITENRFTNVRYSQTKSSTEISRVDTPVQYTKYSPNVHCNRTTGKQTSIINDHPVISNILQSKPKQESNLTVPLSRQATKDDNRIKIATSHMEQSSVTVSKPTKRSYLSEEDQKDLILLLQQQNRKNLERPMPKIETSVSKTVDDLRSPINTTNDMITKTNPISFASYKPINGNQINTVQQYVGHKVKTAALPNNNISDIHNNSSIKIIENKAIKVNMSKSTNDERNVTKKMPLKAKSDSVKFGHLGKSTSTPQDWESVMNAIRAQKTPSRDPTALEIKLKKDAENSLRNQRIVRTTSSTTLQDVKTPNVCHIKQPPNKNFSPNKSEPSNCPTVQAKHITQISQLDNQKNQKENAKIAAHVNAQRKLPGEQKKQSNHEIVRQKDPFISGLENSDYDLLEELMDDELRQEIGELSSDDDSSSYCRSTIQKSNKVTSIRNNVNVTKQSIPCHQKEKNGAVDLRPAQNVCNRLQNSTEMNRSTTKVLGAKSNYHTKTILDSSTIVSSPLTNKNASLHNLGTEVNTNSSNVPILSNKISHQCNEAVLNKNSDKSDYVNKDDDIANNLVSDSRNMYITAIPQQTQTALQNVLLIGSNMFYDPYSAVQTRLGGVAPYVVPNNTPNITLYHTTQFAAPVVNPVIIGNAIPSDNLPRNSSSQNYLTVSSNLNDGNMTKNEMTNVANNINFNLSHGSGNHLPVSMTSNNSPSNFSSQPYLTISTNLNDGNIIENEAMNKNNNINLKLNHRSGNDCLLHVNTSPKLENKVNLDINSNRNCERKVLSEVQEKQKFAAIEKNCSKIKSQWISVDNDIIRETKGQEIDDNTRTSKNETISVDGDLKNKHLNEQERTDVKVITKSLISNQDFPLNKLLKFPKICDDAIGTPINQKATVSDLPKRSSIDLNGNENKTNAQEPTKSHNVSTSNENIKLSMNHENIDLKNRNIITKRKEHSEKDIKNLERLNKKRLAITTRELNHRCCYPPIPLSYVPLIKENGSNSVTDKNQDNQENALKSDIQEECCTNIHNTFNHIQKCNPSLGSETYKENKSIPNECRRILLRSSNKNIETVSTNLNVTKDRKVRLKNDMRDIVQDVIVKKNERNTNVITEKVVTTKRTSKRILSKKSTLKPNAISQISKKVTLNKILSKNDHTVTEKTQDFNVDVPNVLDIEDELLVSKIPNETSKNIKLIDIGPDLSTQQPVDMVSSNKFKSTTMKELTTTIYTNEIKEKCIKLKIKTKLLLEGTNNENLMERPREYIEFSNLRENLRTTECENLTIAASNNAVQKECSNRVKKILTRNDALGSKNKQKQRKNVSSDENNKIDHFVNPKEVGLPETVSVRRVSKDNTSMISKSLIEEIEEPKIKMSNERLPRLKKLKNKTAKLAKENGKNKSVENKEIVVGHRIPESNVSLNSVANNSSSLLCSKKLGLTNEDRTNRTTVEFIDCMSLESHEISSAKIENCQISNKNNIISHKNDDNKSAEINIIGSLKCPEKNNLSDDKTAKMTNTELVNNTQPKLVETASSKKNLIESNRSSNNQPSLLITQKKNTFTETLCITEDTRNLTDQSENVKPVIHENLSTSNNHSRNEINEINQQNSDLIVEDVSSFPESFKKNVIIEEIQDKNVNDSNKKILRIKLPNGRVFKATIYGKLYTDFESLFSDPILKSMLLNNMSCNKRYTLNIKQVTTPNEKDPSKPPKTHIEDIQLHSKWVSTKVDNLIEPAKPYVEGNYLYSKGVPQKVETINLLSDDEDDIRCFVFRTEFGSYKTSFTNRNMYEKHQSRFDQKSFVKLNRYVPTENAPKVLDDNLDEHLVHLSSSCNGNVDTNSHKTLTNCMSDNPAPICISNECTDNSICNKDSEIIEIDDSSNDSIDILKNCPNFPVDILTVAKDIVNQFKEVTDNDVLNKSEENINPIVANNLLENNTSVQSMPSEEDNSLSSIKTRDCVVSLKKCDDLVNKYLDVNKRKCFIKLYRCDESNKNMESSSANDTVTDNTNCDVMDAEDFIPATILSVSQMVYDDSLPILNSMCNKPNDISTSVCTSPVIDVFETIVALQDYVDITKKCSENDHPKAYITCESEWFISKPQLHLRSFSNINLQEQCKDTFKININQNNAETMVSNISHRDQKLPEYRVNVKRECEWFLSKRQLHDEIFSHITILQEKSETDLKNGSIQSSDKHRIINSSVICEIPSLKRLLAVYFQNNPIIHLIGHISDLKIVSTHSLKRKSGFNESSAVASKLLKSTDNQNLSWKRRHSIKNGIFYQKHENTVKDPKSTVNFSDKILRSHYIGNSLKTKEKENCEGTNATNVLKDDVTSNFKQIQNNVIGTNSYNDCTDQPSKGFYHEKEGTLNKDAEKLSEMYTQIKDYMNFDYNINSSSTNTGINQSTFQSTQPKKCDRTIIVEVNVEKIETELCENKINTEQTSPKLKHMTKESTLNDSEIHDNAQNTPVQTANIKEPNCKLETLKYFTEASREEMQPGICNDKITSLDTEHNPKYLESRIEKKYSLLLDHEYTEKFNVSKRESEDIIKKKEKNIGVVENIKTCKIEPSNKIIIKEYMSEDKISKTNQNNNDKNSVEKVMLLYGEDESVVLEGVEYEDPVVGTCYVFPIDENSSVSSGNDGANYSNEEVIEIMHEDVSDSDENVTLYSESNLEVIVPKITYSKATYGDETSTENMHLKRNLKRKIDLADGKHSGKKYRKGKNIDYPKITAAAIMESGYSKEYKRLFDYCSSLKFSFSRAFLKEHVDVSDMIKNWPIEGTCSENADISTDTVDCCLFSDTGHAPTFYNPLNQTLSEEIATEYNDNSTPNINENEINFKMGFGEGSGRVIQNLEEIGDYSKVSAATLSDVKQPQPFVFSEDYDDYVDNYCKENYTRNYKMGKISRYISHIKLHDKVQSFFKETTIENDQIEKINRYISHIKLHDKVQSFFRKTTVELKYDWIKENNKDKFEAPGFSFDFFFQDFMDPSPIDAVVQVVQVGQLPVSAAAQNPVTCDPRVTQVSNASPSQCSVENSPRDDSQTAIKTEYTELTTANLTLPLVQDYGQHNQSVSMESQDVSNLQTTDENIPIETEIKSVVKIELVEELPEDKDETKESHENSESQNLTNKHINNVDYIYDTNNSNTLDDPNIQVIYNTGEKQNVSETFSQKNLNNGASEKTDQIAHAMNAAGITTATETIANTRAHALVNILSQKIRQSAVAGTNTQSTTNNYPKATSINAMALQQALAQILPPPLNQTNMSENNTQTSNTQVTPQVLHIVQGKNASGSQITLVDNTQQSVISTPSATPVLHIVQNKTGTPSATANGGSGAQPNTFSGLSLVDTGLQQGGNQLLHIVNTGNQKNSNTGQLLKRVNLLTNLANVQSSNDQKMVQFVCKSADGKAIQLNAPHQRSMVLRLQPIETPNVQTNSSKPVEPQELNTSQSVTSALTNKDNINAQQEIKSRSVYEENYAKFIQNSSSKPTVPEKSTTLPKFNQAFGKPVFQDGNQKPIEINSSNTHLSSINTGSENADCPPAADNSINLEHMGQISSPPLLLRKSPAQTSQAQPNLVQQLKQTIAPMNIQTMHGGVIYTRQIPVNIGGGQTINLITVPSTELIDDSGQKQQTDVKFVNQGEIEPSIIKIVPQNQSTSNSEISTDDNNAHVGVSNESGQNQQPQPVLTQMRIKLPMLSKTPQMVSGARVVRPSFFQIQRNVIGGANQPVYQQLVLTAAPPLGQQTIRLPQAQVTRQIKVPTESQSSTESQMSSSTLEQLREFDMVLEQVKERSTVQPSATSNSSFTKLHTSSTDTTDNPVSVSSTPTEPTQVLYSIGNNQPLNVAYVNRKATVTTPITSAYVRSPDSSGIVDSPTSSSHVQIPHTVTAETSSNETNNQPKPAKVGSKSKSRPKSSHPPSSMKINTVPPKTSAQKPLEDEQTTQRILYILAEYKEQVENSPDKDKPAPRRRSNPPSNPSGSSKRKKSSSGSRRPGVRDLSPVHGDDTCRTMGSEDSSCGTSQGDCNESCLESHSPQDSPRKVVRKLTFEQETPAAQPRPQPQRNVIVADGQTITVARGTAGKPATAVLMPANYILPVSMVKGGQQIAIVTNRGPKLLTVGGGEGGATNALLLQRLIGPAGLKPVLARPGVRHVRLPTAALHNLQTFNLASATTVQPPDSTASPAPAATPPELVETRANSSPWTDRESQEVKPERGSSPEGSEPWNLPSSADPHDYTYEETVRADNMDRTVLVVQKKDGSSQRQHRLTHVSAAALRHKYAILEHELRLQKSLSEECEDLGVDSPSASDLFPEAELLFAASPAHDHTQDHGHHSHTPQPTLLNQSGIPQPDIDDQIATDQLLPREPMERQDLNLGLEDVGIVTVSEDGMQATIALDQEEFARSHPNTTFHSEPTDEAEVHPFTIAGLKGRHITSTIFHSNRAPATVLMTAPQTTVISQAAAESNSAQNVKYSDIDNMMHSLPSSHTNNINLSSVLVKDDGLTRFDSILNDSRELHLTNTASAIVHSAGNATQVIRRVCYDDDKRERDSRFLMDEPDALIAGDDAKMIAEDSSRDATLESIADDGSSPERHAELFWESNSASERSEGRRPLDFSSDSDKCCKSPSCDETNSTDSSGGPGCVAGPGLVTGVSGVTQGVGEGIAVGARLRLQSVIREARSDGSSDDAPPLRTYPPKRSLSGKTRAGERSPDRRRRASGRGVVKRGCHCCNGEPAPPRPKKPRQRKPAMDFAD